MQTQVDKCSIWNLFLSSLASSHLLKILDSTLQTIKVTAKTKNKILVIFIRLEFFLKKFELNWFISLANIFFFIQFLSQNWGFLNESVSRREWEWELKIIDGMGRMGSTRFYWAHWNKLIEIRRTWMYYYKARLKLLKFFLKFRFHNVSIAVECLLNFFLMFCSSSFYYFSFSLFLSFENLT